MPVVFDDVTNSFRTMRISKQLHYQNWNKTLKILSTKNMESHDQNISNPKINFGLKTIA